MKISDFIRNKLFWAIDLLRGRPIWRHVNDLAAEMEQPFAVTKRDPETKLRGMLSHAYNTTRFYKKFDLAKGISAFPVINKTIIRENEADFYSTAVSTKDRVKVITSGSTGTPFKVYHDKAKRIRNTADTLYFAKLGGYTLGNKLFYLKIWSDYNRKSTLTQWVQNIVPIDVLTLQKVAPTVIGLFNKEKSAFSMIGYVSAFETLCKHLDKNGGLASNVRVNSIITMSEGLNSYTKLRASELFSCPVLSRYSNIENGIIAQQTALSESNFLVNRASYFVEIMDLHTDAVLPYGELGRIVVTDLYNKAMPLIRYDTGDIGILNCTRIGGVDQLVFSTIEGRKLDQIYNTRGELLSSYIVYKNMWGYTDIDQYQFIQHGPRDYLFKICISKKFLREADLIRQFKEYLGEDANFKVEYVNEIPLLSSGKRKKVVNIMYKDVQAVR